MTPQARVQAAIEILDEVIAAARGEGAAADTLVARYFKSRRYAGSKDRRAVRDLVYAGIRRSGERPDSGRAALIGLSADRPELPGWFDGSPHGPAPILAGEAAAAPGAVPAWLRPEIEAAVGAEGIDALLARAPLDLRVNRLKTDCVAVLARLPEARPTPHSPDGIRLPEGSQIEGDPLWEAGAIEVQDEGSQLIALACDATRGMTVVDLCAGAGGKTLALAAAMGGEGRLIACDTHRARLSRLGPRAERAGAAAMIATRLLDAGREAVALADLDGQADVVLVDAPCSGTGTWRRNPEARWRLTPARLDRLTALQGHVLDLAAPLVRPGGALVYAVCSLLAREGSGQVAAFLARHDGWQAMAPGFAAGRPDGAGRLLRPASDGTDGFFVARMIRTC